MRPALAATLLALLLLTGCGGESADLFAVERTGDVPGAQLDVVVNDAGFAGCNDGPQERMPDVARDLAPLADESLKLDPGPQSVLQYTVRTPEGVVRFADTSRGAPPEAKQLAFVVRRIAQEVCGLER